MAHNIYLPKGLLIMTTTCSLNRSWVQKEPKLCAIWVSSGFNSYSKKWLHRQLSFAPQFILVTFLLHKLHWLPVYFWLQFMACPALPRPPPAFLLLCSLPGSPAYLTLAHLGVMNQDCQAHMILHLTTASLNNCNPSSNCCRKPRSACSFSHL